MIDQHILVPSDEKDDPFLTCRCNYPQVQRSRLTFPSVLFSVLCNALSSGIILMCSNTFALADNEPLYTFKFPGEGLGFDSKGRQLIIVHGGIVEVRNMESGRQVAHLEKEGQHFNVLAMDKSRSIAYCATAKGQISRLDLEKFELSDPIVKTDCKVFGMAVSSKDGGMLAFHDAIFDKQAYEFVAAHLKLLDLRTTRLLTEDTFYGIRPTLSFSADGKLLAYSALEDEKRPQEEKVHIRKVDSKEKAKEDVIGLQAQKGMEGLTFVGSKQILAVLESNGVIWFWDCHLKKEVARTSVPTGHYLSAIVCSDQGNLLVIGAGKQISILQYDPLKSIHRMKVLETTAVDKVAISPDAKFLAVSGSDHGEDDQPGHGQVKVWRLDKLLGK